MTENDLDFPPEVRWTSLEIIAILSLLFLSCKCRQTGLMNEYQGRCGHRLSHRRLPGNSSLCKSITRLVFTQQKNVAHTYMDILWAFWNHQVQKILLECNAKLFSKAWRIAVKLLFNTLDDLDHATRIGFVFHARFIIRAAWLKGMFLIKLITLHVYIIINMLSTIIIQYAIKLNY